MERCDFCAVMRIISQYVSSAYQLNQVELLNQLFDLFADDNQDFTFDNGQVCRWFNGIKPISPKIAKFYEDPENSEQLSSSIEFKILPMMYDAPKAAGELSDLVINDVSISEQKRSELTVGLDLENNAAIADFISTVLRFSMTRDFIKREQNPIAIPEKASPIASERIFDGAVPKPCKHFCGRENELNELHELLSKHNKIFVSGIAGIGKSEFVKAYVAKYSKDYTNILYFTYPNSLQKLIADIDFSDDLSSESEEIRFKRHNRFLRSLKEDTLLIIDNFNTVASDEPVLDVLMKYNCKIIFTTRCRFEVGQSFELREISDIETLLNLFAKLYYQTDSNCEIVTQIIETVHRHTFAVELAARLLQSGISEPSEVLKKLSECNVAPDSDDNIKIMKDGKSAKGTFYSHIRTLFSLYLLSEEMQTVMRCMTFAPTLGIRRRLIAKWANLPSMNSINDLVELGFIQESEFENISLHPIVQEITLADLKPSIANCRDLISSISSLCTLHGAELPFSKTMFNVIENIISRAEKDNTALYVLFLKNTFEAMEKERYLSGMQNIIRELESLQSELNPNDAALLWDQKAAIEAMNSNYNAAVKYSWKAAELCVPEENYLLAANVFQNLGYYFHLLGDLNSAKTNLEQGFIFLEKYGQLNHDFITFAHNYANLISDCGEPLKAIRALKKCAEIVKSDIGDMCVEYADILFSIGITYLRIGENSKAEQNLTEAFRVYRTILPEDALHEKCENALGFFNCVNAKIPDCLMLHN